VKLLNNMVASLTWDCCLIPDMGMLHPLPTSVYSTYKSLILDGFLKFWCFSLDWQEWIQKLPLFFPYGCFRFLVRRWVFILYNFNYLHLGPIPLSVLFLKFTQPLVSRGLQFIWYSLLWGCCVVKSREDHMKKSASCVKLSFGTRVDNETRIGMQTHEYVNMM
jgi:hypothetical protein